MIKTFVPLMFRIIAVVFLLTVAVFLQCEKAVAATEDDEMMGKKKTKPRNSDLIFPSSLEPNISVFHHSIIPLVSEAN